MGDIVHIRKLQTAQQVLEDSLTKNLKHVLVLGITEDGANYFEANRDATLANLVWLSFCANDSIQRMVNGK